MPTYEYECESCGKRFERSQKMTEEPLSVCPDCGEKVHRLITGGTGFILKGDGVFGDTTGVSENPIRCGRPTTCCGRDTPCDERPCDR